MKRSILVAGLLLLFGFFPGSIKAGGNNFNATLMVDKASVVADGSSTVNLKVYTWVYKCDANGITSGSSEACAFLTPSTYTTVPVASIDQLRISVSGSNNILEGNTTFTTPSSGYHTISLKSSQAEAKTITLTYLGAFNIVDNDWITTKSVTFTVPVVSNNVTPTNTTVNNNGTTSSRQTTASQQSVNTATNTSTTVSAPVVPAPVIQLVKTDNAEVKKENLQNQTFGLEAKKVFSGVTVPNGVVTLYFHSDPFEDIVTADAQGNWSYELTRDLGIGEHSLELAVTDPVTKLTSVKSEAVHFTLVKGEGTVEKSVELEKKKINNFWYVVIALTGVFVIGGGLFIYFFLHKRTKLAG